MDRFDAMRAFVQVVDSGSYTRAARQLDLHKATVSQQIQQLENRLGTRLLARTTRSVTPTAEGLAYYRHARTILEQVDEAEAMLRRAVAIEPSAYDLQFALGDFLLRQGGPSAIDEVAAIAARMSAIDPSRPEAGQLRAVLGGTR